MYVLTAQKKNLPQKKIPTKGDVLSRILFEISNTKKRKISAAMKLVADEVMAIWSERRKTVEQRGKKSVVRSMKQLHKKYFDLKKNSSRNIKIENEKREHFVNDLAVEFEIKATPKINRMETQSDLESSSEDQSNADASESVSSNYPSNDDDSEYEENVPISSNRQKKLRITPELVSAIDHAGLSDFQATSVTLSVAKYLGMDLSQLSVSRSTFNRDRAKIRAEISQQIKRKFIENIDDQFVVLHWDGKILEKWSSVEGKSDRLAIVASCGKESKILGVAELSDGTALTQFNAIESTLNEWNIDNVKALMSDTTAANSGEIRGVSKRLRDKYNNKVLSFYCRHHILEVMISKVYAIALKDVSESPNIGLFVRFKEIWNTLDASKFESCERLRKVQYAISGNERKQIVKFVREQLTLQKKGRKDYIEFLQLTLLFLGEKENVKKTIRVPGALHRARFMARVIYCLKIALFRRQFKLSGMFEFYFTFTQIDVNN